MCCRGWGFLGLRDPFVSSLPHPHAKTFGCAMSSFDAPNTTWWLFPTRAEDLCRSLRFPPEAAQNFVFSSKKNMKGFNCVVSLREDCIVKFYSFHPA